MTRCCGTSVGVIIQNHRDEYLMITRGWWPRGTAPVAGHIKDAHSNAADAAVAEAAEEVGLTIYASREIWSGHLTNLCASPPAVPVAGHHWSLRRATIWAGTVTPAPGETRGAAWYSHQALRAMAERTLAHYRAGGTPDTQPHDSLEAVWLRLLVEAGEMCFDDLVLAEVEQAYSTAPAEYWRG